MASKFWPVNARESDTVLITVCLLSPFLTVVVHGGMAIDGTAAAFIGASVTLVLVIIFMILMVVLVRQCLAFLAKRALLRQQLDAVRQHQERQRRMSVTEPVKPTFNWHHSIRIAGTPPPTYVEAKDLPPLENDIVKMDKSDLDIHRLSAHLDKDDVHTLDAGSTHSGTEILTRQDTDSLHSGTEHLATTFGNANALLSDSSLVNTEASPHNEYVSIEVPSEVTARS